MKSKNVVGALIYLALPPASAKGQIHQKCHSLHCFSVPCPCRKKTMQPEWCSWFACTDSKAACFSLWSCLSGTLQQRTETWEMELHSLWGFVAKLLLKKHHVYIELVVLELAQRTLSLISKAQKSKEEEEVNQRSVPRTTSFGSDHRGHCTVNFLSSSSLSRVCAHLYKRSELCKTQCKISLKYQSLSI